ncbi:hypothetical protein HanPSC8_Chr06g0242431 [Helianthus annuus]|nr:hypothetical protein HanPSC8_Chr06g0242431 [Helianthus annuus]
MVSTQSPDAKIIKEGQVVIRARLGLFRLRTRIRTTSTASPGTGIQLEYRFAKMPLTPSPSGS